jgi:uncharacterized damage-inducible protein DinB
MARTSMKALIIRLMRPAAWADARALASLQAAPEPPADAVRLMAHVIAAERIYLARVRGEDPFPQDFWPERTLDQVASEARDTGEALAAFVAARGEDELRRPVRYRNSRGEPFATPIHEMLAHVALHGEHHRGQVALLVRRAGGTPAMTDLIAFVREHPGDG